MTNYLDVRIMEQELQNAEQATMGDHDTAQLAAIALALRVIAKCMMAAEQRAQNAEEREEFRANVRLYSDK